MNDKTNHDSFADIETKSCISIILSIVALVISSLLMFPCLPRILSSKELQFDYIGAVIGILSLLVTALIGWNIYQVINIKRIKEQIQKDVDEKTRLVLASLHYNSFLAFKNNSSVGAVTSLIMCLNQLLKNTDEEAENIERIIREIKETFNKVKGTDVFGANNRRMLYKTIREIEKINDYDDEILNDILKNIKARLNNEREMEGRK